MWAHVSMVVCLLMQCAFVLQLIVKSCQLRNWNTKAIWNTKFEGVGIQKQTIWSGTSANLRHQQLLTEQDLLWNIIKFRKNFCLTVKLLLIDNVLRRTMVLFFSFFNTGSACLTEKMGTWVRNHKIKISVALEENKRDEKMTDGHSFRRY